MTTVQETKRLLYYRDLFIANFWRYLVQSLWLHFPPILFLILAYLIFWHIPQGKDLIVISLQNARLSPAIFPCFIIALIFWCYMTWYSTRIVARAKHFEHPDENHLAATFRVQTPRILAFTCITIIFLALFQLDNPAYKFQISPFWCHILFAVSFSWYFLIWKFWTWYLKKKKKETKNYLKFLVRARWITYSVLVSSIITIMIVRNFWGLVVFLIILQMGLVLLLILRRDITEAKGETVNYYSPKRNDPNITVSSSIFKKIWHIVMNDDDERYFIVFNIVSLTGIIVYVSAIVSVDFSVKIGSFPFMLLAFGVLLGFGNLVTLISVFARFNFHLLFFIAAFIIGYFVDPHTATVVEKENPSALFSNRQNLRGFFLQWLNDKERIAEIEKIDTLPFTKKYPIYFVMANGGASRSGYWTASILARFEDSTNESFSRHLFCLSGASGGSVGTATFFSLLKGKNELKKRSDTTFTAATTSFLQSDFLTYTLAHLLGPDIFRNVFPFGFSEDRASALAIAMERASGENSFMYDRFADRFSSFITQKDRDYQLPLLCINTTRMQDSRPGVISNINIKEDSAIFNNRIDVLGLLKEDEDMKLSTAVVLGASFPYISPASRINSWISTDSGSHYFVDGGYFDNSGAGVVNEMMIAMNTMLNNKKDKAFEAFRNKIEFQVIHISNAEPKKKSFARINTIANDLLAPVRTLMGSYGTQTTINDQRLKNYLHLLYDNDTHYTNIDLYGNNQKIKYTMNWVISRSQLDSMASNLARNEDIHKAYLKMDSLFHVSH